MIENLKGTHEFVNYKESTQIRLYDNDEAENYPPHWHTPFELIMPTEGTYQVLCGNEIYDLKERHILIICPYTIHSLNAPDIGRRIIFQPYLEISQALKSIESIISMIAPAILITPESHHDVYQKIYQLVLEISDEYFADRAFSAINMYNKFLSILILIGQNHAEHTQRIYMEDPRQKDYMEKFISICNYMIEHCAEDLSLEQAAHLAGFSKYHFSRLFKQFTNVSYYKYLNQKRISLASSLLCDPQLSVTEVAIRSGYTSATSFIRMFKQVNQCTPTEFRRMYTENQLAVSAGEL